MKVVVCLGRMVVLGIVGGHNSEVGNNQAISSEEGTHIIAKRALEYQSCSEKI